MITSPNFFYGYYRIPLSFFFSFFIFLNKPIALRICSYKYSKQKKNKMFSEKNVLFEGLTKLWLKYLKVHKN